MRLRVGGVEYALTQQGSVVSKYEPFDEVSSMVLVASSLVLARLYAWA